MGSRRSKLFATASCAWLLLGGTPARASPELFVDLRYEVDPTVGGCPSQAELRSLVARQLGYDPHRTGSTIGVVVRAWQAEQRIRGAIDWTGIAKERAGKREFVSRNRDCRELMATMGFVMAVQIQVMAREPAGLTTPDPAASVTPGSVDTKSSAQAEPSHLQSGADNDRVKPVDTKPGDAKPGDAKPGDAKPGDTKPGDAKPVDTKPGDTKPVDTKPVDTKPGDAKPVDAKPVDTRPAGAEVRTLPTLAAPAAPHSRSWATLVGLGPSVGLGVGPEPLAQGRVFFAMQAGAAVLEVGAEASLPSTTRQSYGGGFRHELMLGTLAACAQKYSISLCGLAKMGRVEVTGVGVDRTASPDGFLAQVGLRLAYSLGLSDRIVVLGHIDGLYPLTHWTVDLNHLHVWTMPRIGGVTGIDAAIRFR